jgi:hypothetical protein
MNQGHEVVVPSKGDERVVRTLARPGCWPGNATIDQVARLVDLAGGEEAGQDLIPVGLERPAHGRIHADGGRCEQARCGPITSPA